MTESIHLAHDNKSLELLQRTARRWARERFAPVQAELERQWCPELPDSVLYDIGEQGWLPGSSEALGDWSPSMIATLGQALGAEAAAAFLTVLTHGLAAHLSAGSPLAECRPESGSAVLAASPYWDFSNVPPCVKVEFAGGTASLGGSHPLVVNARRASRIIVPALSPDGELAICSVDPQTPGVGISAPIPVLGVRGASCRNIAFDAVALSPENIVCRGGDARSSIEFANRWLGWGVVGMLTGIVAKACEQAGDYVELRMQGGRRIIEHPPVAKLIDTAVSARDELSLWLGQCCAADDPPPAPLRQACKRALTATDAAMQSFGGLGYMCPGTVERCWRDARQAATLGSTKPYFAANIRSRV